MTTTNHKRWAAALLLLGLGLSACGKAAGGDFSADYASTAGSAGADAKIRAATNAAGEDAEFDVPYAHAVCSDLDKGRSTVQQIESHVDDPSGYSVPLTAAMKQEGHHTVSLAITYLCPKYAADLSAYKAAHGG